MTLTHQCSIDCCCVYRCDALQPSIDRARGPTAVQIWTAAPVLICQGDSRRVVGSTQYALVRTCPIRYTGCTLRPLSCLSSTVWKSKGTPMRPFVVVDDAVKVLWAWSTAEEQEK